MGEKLKYKRPSTYLIILAGLIIGIGIIMALLTNDTINNLKNDAKIINRTGIIRGSIQRTTKLAIAGKREKLKKVINEINFLIKKIFTKEEVRESCKEEKNIVNNLNRFKKSWILLQNDLLKYQKHPTASLKEKLIEESEICWKTADAMVLSTQLVTEYKVGGIKSFYIIIILNVITALMVICLVLLYVRKKLEVEALHDPLTNVYNKRSFQKLMEYEINKTERYNRNFSLILFDIDFFKKINDKYGHQVGDYILIELTQLINGSIRNSDILCRIGGEEFAIISSETNLEQAYSLSEKIRKTVENYKFKTAGKVTISLGIAQYSKGMSKYELYNNADKALYVAKQNGRNRTEKYSECRCKNCFSN